MIPSQFICLDDLPLMRSGKVDYSALISSLAEKKPERKSVPTNEIEQILLEIGSEIYGTDDIGFDDHFIDMGGDSLKMMRMINRIRSRLGFEISYRSLFDYPTIRTLSAFLMEG